MFLNRCQVNCDYKVNINNQLSVRSTCSNCERENFTSMSYKWELYVRDELTRNWTLDLDLDSKAMTNTSEKNLVLRKNCLDVGRKYRLIFRAENEGQ